MAHHKGKRPTAARAPRSSYAYSAVRALSLNQDRGCFTCCLDSGLRIYNVEPLVEKLHYGVSEIGDVLLCEMLYRTNILFIVKKNRDETLMVYDDAKHKYVSEITFPSPIKAVKARREKLAVALEYCIYLVKWPSGGKAQQILQTPSNPLGLCEITTLPGATKRLLAAPGHKIGSVQLMDIDTSAAVSLLSCHSGALRCLSLSVSGMLLATASERGTLLRVWCTRRRQLLHTLRRGSDYATLYCINFSRGGELLCCCSDKGTLHVFQISGGSGSSGYSSATSSLAAASGAILGGERPFASGSIPREQPAICAFVNNTSVVGICADGTFHKYIFTNEGVCQRDAFDIYLQMGDDDEFIT